MYIYSDNHQVPILAFYFPFLISGVLSELVRTNELCQSYSEACIKLCKELDVKVVDLFTALQKRDDWRNACFT